MLGGEGVGTARGMPTLLLPLFSLLPLPPLLPLQTQGGRERQGGGDREGERQGERETEGGTQGGRERQGERETGSEKFSRVAELQPLRASRTLSFTQTRRFVVVSFNANEGERGGSKRRLQVWP